MADGGWDIGETIFIGANGERAAEDGNLNRKEAEEGYYLFLRSFRDTDDTFFYRYLLVFDVAFSFLTLKCDH